MKHNRSSNLVYSTETGRTCPKCEQPKNQCRCKKGGSQPKGDGIVRLSRQTKGRKGSGVTLVTGIPLAGEELKKLAKTLKQVCGSGGTIKDGIIEIQGDHRQVLADRLKQMGYTTKVAGG